MESVAKTKALALRKQGYSLKEIASQFSIAKSTASVWVSEVPISKSGYNRLRERTEKALAKAHKTIAERNNKERLIFAKENYELVNKILPLNKDTAKLFTALLYWCEGAKCMDNLLKFANSDPSLVKFFLACLRMGFSIKQERLKCIIHLHKYHDISKQTKFWSKVTGIPISQFNRPYLKPNSGHNIRPGYPGCIAIAYCDKIVAREVFSLIKVLSGTQL